MSIGNQKIWYTKKIRKPNWYSVFLSQVYWYFLAFYRYFENALVKIWLNIGIFRQNKSGSVYGLCGCHFICIGLVLVCHFPENDISSAYQSAALRLQGNWHLLSTYVPFAVFFSHGLHYTGCLLTPEVSSLCSPSEAVRISATLCWVCESVSALPILLLGTSYEPEHWDVKVILIVYWTD